MKLFKLYLTILLSTVLLTNCTEDEIDFYGNIHGTVKDVISSEPLPGVAITLSPSGKTMITGSDGVFEFKDLETGKYTVSVSKDKYGSDSKSITVQPGGTSQADFNIQTANGSLVLSIPTLNFGLNDIDLGFDLKNIGKNDMTFEIENSYDWLTVSPANGTISSTRIEPIVITIDRSKIDEDKTVRLPISSNAGSAEIEIKVTFNTMKAEMILSKSVLDFDKTNTTLSFDISNKGKSDLTFSIGELGEWIIFAPTTGTITPGELTTVTATIDRSKVTESIDQSLTISSNVGSQELPVKVEKPLIAGVLEVSESYIDFGETYQEKTFIISNTGTAPFDYTLMGSNMPWLSSPEATGTVLAGKTKTITLNIDRSIVFGEVSENLKVSTEVGDKNITLAIYEPIKYGTVESCDESIVITIQDARMSGNDLHIDLRMINNGETINQFRFGSTRNNKIGHAIDNNSNTYYLDDENKQMTVEFNGKITDDEYGYISLIGGGASVDGEIVIIGVDDAATTMKTIRVYTDAYMGRDFIRDHFTLSNVPIIR